MMTREEILHMAELCVTGVREEHYGSPEKNFTAIGRFWTDYLIAAGVVDPKWMVELDAENVAVMMCLFKIARLSTGDYQTVDSFVDLAGYAACAGEIATEGDKND
jgi:hypothetical protein